jgi:hypothetical protein
MNLLHQLGIFPSCMSFILSLYLSGMLGLAHPKEQAKIFRIGDEGLSPCYLLPLAALGGKECGATDLVSSTEALKSFLIHKGLCFFS